MFDARDQIVAGDEVRYAGGRRLRGRGRGRGRVGRRLEIEVDQAMGVVERRPEHLAAGQVLEGRRDAAPKPVSEPSDCHDETDWCGRSPNSTRAAIDGRLPRGFGITGRAGPSIHERAAHLRERRSTVDCLAGLESSACWTFQWLSLTNGRRSD
jgi:hypothetical protein